MKKNAEGNQKIDYVKLSEKLYFLNWIEQDDWTVSQVLDTKRGQITAYWSFANNKSIRGKRKVYFSKGGIQISKMTKL